MLEALAQTPLSDLPHRDAVRLDGAATVAQAVAALAAANRGAVLVEDPAGRLVGIFTEHDVARLVVSEPDGWSELPLRAVMRDRPTTVAASATVADALRTMQAARRRHVPLLDSHGHAVGVVSVRDLLAFFAGHFPEAFLNLPPSPGAEARQLWGG